jgi:hypothetical protein
MEALYCRRFLLVGTGVHPEEIVVELDFRPIRSSTARIAGSTYKSNSALLKNRLW